MWSSGVCEEKYSEMGWPRLREWERMCWQRKHMTALWRVGELGEDHLLVGKVELETILLWPPPEGDAM